MKAILSLVCLLSCAAETLPDWPPETRSRNAAMKAQLDAWLSAGDSAQQPLYVVYLYCSDQEPFPGHRDRLNRVLSEVQNWYRSQHEAAGFGQTTFALEREPDGRVKLHQAQLPVSVKSRYKVNIRETRDACVAAARTVLGAAGIDYSRSFVLMLTTIPDDHGAAPFFGSMIQDRGYCFAVDTPWLDTEYSKMDGPKVWKGRPVGPANSALIGGIAHELGHGFGLPHCDEHAAQRVYGESLMGSGNYTWRQERRNEGKGTFLLDTDACFLIARPPFTGATRDRDRQPQPRVEYLQLEQGADGRVAMSATVRSDIPVYAVRVYDDPPGNHTYNAVSWVAAPDPETGALALDFTPLHAAGDHELVITLYHSNGRWTTLQSTMPVTKNGRADLAPVRRKLFRLPSPALVTGARCPLAVAQAESVKVGWGRLLIGETPQGPLQLAGKRYEEGLFAHSPSRIVYRLGGKWQSFTVTAGLQDGTATKATFRILGDGRELALQADLGGAKEWSIDVTGVDVLELLTEPPATGNRSSWTIWAAPTLMRSR